MSMRKKYSEKEDKFIIKNYGSLGAIALSKVMGRTPIGITSRAGVLGVRSSSSLWSDDEKKQLVELYQSCDGGSIDLFPLSEKLNRSRNSIMGKAKQLGLTNNCRPMSQSAKEKAKVSPRNRKVGAWTKEQDEFLIKNYMSMTRSQIGERIGRTRGSVAKRCSDLRMNKKIDTGASWNRNTHYSGSRRIDLRNKYFRSSWEANYARILNHWIKCGKIKKWDYECKTFYIPSETIRPYSYRPDFRVTYPCGREEWHEVKGWATPRFIKKMKLFAEHYPDVSLLVIAREEYESLRDDYCWLPYWEFSEAEKNKYDK